MPQDGPHEATQDKQPLRRVPETPSGVDWRDKLGIPEPVKRVFRKFPLTTYSENELPCTAPDQRHVHSLWVWTTAEGARRNDVSFNPKCLKWQVREYHFSRRGRCLVDASTSYIY